MSSMRPRIRVARLAQLGVRILQLNAAFCLLAFTTLVTNMDFWTTWLLRLTVCWRDRVS